MSVAFTDLLFVLSWESAVHVARKHAWHRPSCCPLFPGCRAHLYNTSHPCFSHQGSPSVSRRCCIFSEWARNKSYKCSHTASFPNTGFTDSLVTICQIWSVQSSRRFWLYTMLFEVLFFLFVFFLFFFIFFLIHFGFFYSQKWNLGFKDWKNSTEMGSLQKIRTVNFLSVLYFTLVSGKW